MPTGAAAETPSAILDAGRFLRRGGDATSSARSRLARPWRIIPQVDQNPKLVLYAQSLSGRSVIGIAAMALVVVFTFLGIDFTAAPFALACAYSRKLRRYLIPLTTLAFLVLHGFWVDVGAIRRIVSQEGLMDRVNVAWLFPGMLPPVFVASWLLIASWPRLAIMPILRRPTLCLIVGLTTLAAIAELPITAGLPRVILWSLLLTAQPYLWFMAYALADARASKRENPAWQRLGVFHPFWGASLTPFGKGKAYLARYDAKTPEELAVTQLKGLKLACWTLLLVVCLRSFDGVIRDVFALPSFDRVFLDHVGGTRDPRYLCWASLMASFVKDVLTMTIWGGTIVACARLAGFRLLRNTYRPLQARTLAEFWNRYYFFYKELLVDHFFYPVFMKCFRSHRRLRVFFATFMAACVGNLLFHFLRDIHFVAEMGWWRAIRGESSHAFYTILLAVGVGLSQLRERPRGDDRRLLRGRIVPCVWVIMFFCILHVFDAPLDRVHTIAQRAQFLSYLLGIDTWT